MRKPSKYLEFMVRNTDSLVFLSHGVQITESFLELLRMLTFWSAKSGLLNRREQCPENRKERVPIINVICERHERKSGNFSGGVKERMRSWNSELFGS